jgi:hypothetical protein
VCRHGGVRNGGVGGLGFGRETKVRKGQKDKKVTLGDKYMY